MKTHLLQSRFAFVLPLLLLVAACSEEPQAQPLSPDVLKGRLELTKKLVKETDAREHVGAKTTSTMFVLHMDRVHTMLDKVKTELATGNTGPFDFTKQYAFFQSQKRYDASCFTQPKLSAEEALLVIDQLCYEIRHSGLGAGDYVYDSPCFDFRQSRNGDSLDVSIRLSDRLRPAYILGSTSGNIDDDMKKATVNNNDQIDISGFKKGDTIRGRILLRRGNGPYFEPFEYVKR